MLALGITKPREYWFWHKAEAALTPSREINTQDQPQTTAVDIWSLGIVVLTMLTHHMGVSLSGLDGMDQERLEAFLHNRIFQGPKRFSRDCQKYIRQCLEVSPPRRMTALDAQCHDWMLRPNGLRERFRELDMKTMSSWKVSTLLKPMPFELPDVMAPRSEAGTEAMCLGNGFQPTTTGVAGDASRYFEEGATFDEVFNNACLGSDVSAVGLDGSLAETRRLEQMARPRGEALGVFLAQVSPAGAQPAAVAQPVAVLRKKGRLPRAGLGLEYLDKSTLRARTQVLEALRGSNAEPCCDGR